jgi:chromosomal replication initiation ATPase DnaA
MPRTKEHTAAFSRSIPRRVRAIIRDAADRFETTESLVLGPLQERQCVQARCAVARRLRNEGYSLTVIGRWLNRHHTTVVHMLKHSVEAAAAGDVPVPDLSGEWAI